MSFNQFVAILRARWIVLLAILGVTVMSAVGLTMMLQKRYTASATVLVDVKSPDPVAGMVLPATMSPTYMATQVDLLQSDRVARRVVTLLNLTESPEMRAEWMQATKGVGDFEGWLVDAIQGGVKVTPSRESNVIKVEFGANDPRKAATYANAYVEAFMAVTADLRTEPAKLYGANFSTLSSQLRIRLEAAQKRLSDFQRDSGLNATDERMDVETSRLADLSGQVMQLQSLTSDVGVRIAEAKTTGIDSSSDAMSNSLITQLRSDMIREEAKLDQLTLRLGDSHPSVQEERAAIASLRSRLNTELSRISRAMGSGSGISGSRLKQATASLEAQREKMAKLRGERNKAVVMQRDVENLQRAYDAVESRVSQATMEAGSTQTNLSVIEAAKPPATHSSPKMFFNLLVALALGSVISAVTVLLVELVDRRVRANDDISKDLNLPLIGVMLKTPNASRGLLTKRTAPWVINRNLPAPNQNA
jgi:succinoglycan biosynthesis transport protein ExoP